MVQKHNLWETLGVATSLRRSWMVDLLETCPRYWSTFFEHQHGKWTVLQDNLAVVVLVMNHQTKITKVYSGQVEFVRVAKVMLTNSELKHLTTKLYPLPLK
ncbi:hypothetical protein PR048_019666, partial [Dryococelus australis]